MLPKLPNFPKFPRRTSSSELDGSIPIISSSIALRESHDIVSLIDARREGKELSVDLGSPIARYHGCRSCPWYGSSFCFEKVVPPSLHVEGICSGRLNEVLDIAELYDSPDGLQIRKRETVERIRRHILLLEANLADYTLKRAELMPDLAAKPILNPFTEKYVSLEGELGPEVRFAVAERTLELSQFDPYQRSLQGQIQILSTKFAELLKEDEKLQLSKGEGSGRTILNIQQLNILLSDSAKRLAEIESQKDEKGK